MRLLVVTSEVTLVKNNYNDFFESLFKNYPHLDEIEGLVVLQNNNKSMLIKGLGLILIGAKLTGKNLIQNSINAHHKDHEKVAKKYSIRTFYFKSANDPQFLEFVKERKIDLIVNARTRDIYKKKILKAPQLGCINIHHGILPDYRGLMCDLYALNEGRDAGFSIHKMESKIDEGGILKNVVVTKKRSSRNFPDHIHKSANIEGVELSKTLLEIRENKKIVTIENKSSNINYTKNPTIKEIKKMIKKGIIL